MRLRTLAGATTAMVLGTGLFACNDITSINNNPNGPTDVPPPAVLSNVLQGTFGTSSNAGVEGPGMLNIRGAGLWAQYYSEIQYRDEDKYILRPGTDGGWGFYNGALENAQRMIDGGTAAGAPNWDAVGRIMKSYLFSVMTDAMGDIPYSQALNGDSILQPKYDTQQAIYTSLFADLTKASQEIDPSGVGFSQGDLVYNGDMSKWQMFANSLRLRLAIHLSNVDASTAASEAQAAISAGVFQSNADNMELMYLSASPNQNPIYTNYHVTGRDDYGLSKTYVDSLLSWNDPRLPIFAQPNADGVYEGLPNGLNDGEGAPIKEISRIGALWRENAAAPLDLMTYSEVLFLEAEAAQRGWIPGDPAALYTAAIRASMEQYGVAGPDITAYLAEPRVQYNAATGLTQIAYQKWVSLYMQGMEGWTEVRRTGVPHLVPGPNAVLSSIPERLPYGDDELVLNADNVGAAVSSQGFSSSTDLSTPLWFTGR